jgi:hypothetical protein
MTTPRRAPTGRRAAIEAVSRLKTLLDLVEHDDFLNEMLTGAHEIVQNSINAGHGEVGHGSPGGSCFGNGLESGNT